MSVTEKTKIGTIDLTPTWSGVLPVLLELYENSNGSGRATAFEEMLRMASLADMYVESQKGGDKAA